MRKFTIEIVDKNSENHQEFIAECISFPEAVRFAYNAKNRLGLDWKIISVQLFEEEKENE